MSAEKAQQKVILHGAYMTMEIQCARVRSLECIVGYRLRVANIVRSTTIPSAAYA